MNVYRQAGAEESARQLREGELEPASPELLARIARIWLASISRPRKVRAGMSVVKGKEDKP
jgi:hypothetical protein